MLPVICMVLWVVPIFILPMLPCANAIDVGARARAANTAIQRNFIGQPPLCPLADVLLRPGRFPTAMSCQNRYIHAVLYTPRGGFNGCLVAIRDRKSVVEGKRV